MPLNETVLEFLEFVDHGPANLGLPDSKNHLIQRETAFSGGCSVR